jgi:hypothetical protein
VFFVEVQAEYATLCSVSSRRKESSACKAGANLTGFLFLFIYLLSFSLCAHCASAVDFEVVPLGFSPRAFDGMAVRFSGACLDIGAVFL